MDETEAQGIESLAARMSSAREAFTRALDSERDVTTLFRLVDSHYRNETISRPVLRRILVVDPQNMQALTQLGQLELLLGENSEAYSLNRRALERAPNDPVVLLLKASLSNDWDERIALYRRILSINPDNEDAKTNLQQATAFREDNRPTLTWPPGQHPPETDSD